MQETYLDTLPTDVENELCSYLYTVTTKAYYLIIAYEGINYHILVDGFTLELLDDFVQKVQNNLFARWRPNISTDMWFKPRKRTLTISHSHRGGLEIPYCKRITDALLKIKRDWRRINMNAEYFLPYSNDIFFAPLRLT